MTQVALSPFNEVIDDFRAGKMVIIVDHVDRENEGDIVIATEALTPEAIAFMMNYARGLICVSISDEIAKKLDIPLQVLNNNSPFNTQFTISIDNRQVGNEGVTAQSRCITAKSLIGKSIQSNDLVSPGHVFPLVANPAGVLGRQGQTEGSYDLARIAGFESSGVICEILNPDGTMARGSQVTEFAKKHGLKVTSVDEIIRYRVHSEVLAREVASSELSTDHGVFSVYVFEDDADGKEHLVLQKKPAAGEPSDSIPLVRIHSECLTGDVFTSRRCDCGEQLDHAMRQIAEEPTGYILYLRQEGRGIGLANKLRAYELQDVGHDTVEANNLLGFPADARDFAVAAKILNHFGLSKIRLLTNNPDKFNSLTRHGIEIAERVPVIAPPDELSKSYLETKRDKLGHWL